MNTRDLNIIKVPGDCHLFSGDCYVGYARIIWVDDKGGPVILEVVDAFFL